LHYKSEYQFEYEVAIISINVSTIKVFMKNHNKKGGEDNLKSWKLLVLCASISLLALSLTVALAAAYYTGYHYYNFSFDESGGEYDCDGSVRYVNIISIKAGIPSATPTPYSIYAGYWSTLQWGQGNGDVDVLTAPGYGPTSPSGSWYAIWGNAGPNPETVYGVVRITDDQPIPQRLDE
jgi:hypothetical protein